MTNNSSWWANKLQGDTPRYTLSIPAATQPAPVQQVQQAPVQQAPVHTKEVLDPSRPENAEISMGDAMRLWKGGEAHRKEGHLSCPSCGSSTGFTSYSGMSAGAARVNGQQPRPHCFECGYNGSFAQGLESSWA